jgi:hypothetical protein
MVSFLVSDPLRILLAAHPEVLSALLHTIHRVIATFLIKQSEQRQSGS